MPVWIAGIQVCTDAFGDIHVEPGFQHSMRGMTRSRTVLEITELAPGDIFEVVSSSRLPVCVCASPLPVHRHAQL